MSETVQPLDPAVLADFEARIEAAEGDYPAQQAIIGEYYQYLAEHGHWYGNLAWQASQDEGVPGRLANAYMDAIALRYLGAPLDPTVRDQIMVGLAKADIALRLRDPNTPLMPRQIAEYHWAVFADVAHLPRIAWTGTIFELWLHTGSWLMGMGPAEQNGGALATRELIDFLHAVNVEGSEARADYVAFMGAMWNDDVLSEVLWEVATEDFGSAVEFVGNFVGFLAEAAADSEDWGQLVELAQGVVDTAATTLGRDSIDDVFDLLDQGTLSLSDMVDFIVQWAEAVTFLSLLEVAGVEAEVLLQEEVTRRYGVGNTAAMALFEPYLAVWEADLTGDDLVEAAQSLYRSVLAQGAALLASPTALATEVLEGFGAVVADFLNLIEVDGESTVAGGLAGGGDDRLEGTAGEDLLRGGAGNDELTGLGGDDRLFGDDGDELLAGGEGDDFLEGQEGMDRLNGDGGNDVLDGGAANDLLDGGEGTDVLDGGDGDDVLDGGGGNDQLLGGTGSDALDGGEDADLLEGGEGTDVLDGGAGEDSLEGGGGSDLLLGGEGNDTLDGGADPDRLEGGAGYDLYRAGAGDTIRDEDRSGQVQFAGGVLKGGLWDEEAGCYVSRDGRYRYTLAGSTLTVVASGGGESVTIEGYVNRALGIVLDTQKEKEGGGGGGGAPEAPIDYDPNRTRRRPSDPLVLDLNGDGVVGTTSLEGSVAYFDLDGDGWAEHTGWVAPEDALLAYDRNGNGVVDDIGELFGSNTTHGMDQLIAQGDGNGDGRITAVDPLYSRLLVWQDGNGDGISQAGELKGLREAGITAIAVETTPAGQASNGNRIVGWGQFTLGGSAHVMADVDFLMDDAVTRANPGYSHGLDPWEGVAAQSYGLPWLRGFGSVPDLAVAMAGDAALAGSVAGLAEAGPRAIYEGFDALLAGWSGLGAVWAANGITARVPTVTDMVWMVESFAGVSVWKPQIARAFPSFSDGFWAADTAAYVTDNYLKLKEHYYVPFAVQALYGEALAGVYYSTEQDALVLYDRELFYDSAAQIAAGLSGEEEFLFFTEFLTRYQEAWGLDWGALAPRIEVSGPGSELLTGVLAGEIEEVRTFQTRYSGGSGDEAVTGTAGADRLEGGGGNDRLQGDGGDDSLSGGEGDDQYLFQGAFGSDTVVESGTGGGDLFRFGVGIAPAAVTVTSAGSDLVLTVAGGGRIVVKGWFLADAAGEAAGGNRIERVEFADGTVWDGVELMAHLVTVPATAGNDSLYGGGGADTLDGLAGDDLLAGGSGDDSYRFGRGSGRDTVDERGGGGVDTVQFGEGIGVQDLVFLRQGEDLAIGIAGGDDRLTIKGWYAAAGPTVERLAFADGTVVEMASLSGELTGLARTLEGGPGSDYLLGTAADERLLGLGSSDRLYGKEGADLLDGGSDDDYLDGGAGVDVYLFGRGSGADVIWDSGAESNVLRLGPGVAFSDLTFQRSSSDLIIGIAGSGDRLTVSGWFYRSPPPIGRLELADGTTVGVDELNALLDEMLATVVGTDRSETLTGTDGGNEMRGLGGNDWLDGMGGDDTLDGGTGDDRLNGGKGNDLYLFGRGSGRDVLTTGGGAGDGTDTVLFGAGISPADVAVSRYYDDLTLTIAGTRDSVTFQGWFYPQNTPAADRVEFADGTVWDAATLSALANSGSEGHDYIAGSEQGDTINGLGGNDTIYGAGGDDRLFGDAGNDYLDGGSGNNLLDGGTGVDTLIGGLGADTLSGGEGNDWLHGYTGNDTYLYRRGDGFDVIYEYFFNGTTDSDVLQFGEGIAPADLEVRRDSSSLYLSFVDGSGQVQIANWYSGSWSRIGRVEFADGTVWDAAYLTSHARYGTLSNDYISGGDGADNLSGWLGSDRLYGNGGDDRLDGGEGNDSLWGGNGNDAPIGGGGNDSLAGDAGNDRLDGDIGADTLYGGDGDDGVAGGDGDDRLWGENGSDSVDGGAGSDELRGGEGDDRLAGGDGNDKLWGENGDDTLDGGAGDDALSGGKGYDELLGGEGNDQLSGEEGGDLLDGGAGDDTLTGGSGADHYRFGPGYGRDVVNENDTAENIWDVLQLTGVAPAEVQLAQSGMDLEIRLIAGGDTLVVPGWYDGTAHRIERIELDDGTVWQGSDLPGGGALLTEGDDYLIGTRIADRYDGLAGNDVLIGDEGDDALLGSGGGRHPLRRCRCRCPGGGHR